MAERQRCHALAVSWATRRVCICDYRLRLRYTRKFSGPAARPHRHARLRSSRLLSRDPEGLAGRVLRDHQAARGRGAPPRRLAVPIAPGLPECRAHPERFRAVLLTRPARAARCGRGCRAAVALRASASPRVARGAHDRQSRRERAGNRRSSGRGHLLPPRLSAEEANRLDSGGLDGVSLGCVSRIRQVMTIG